MKIGDIKGSVEIIKYNCEFAKLNINKDMNWDREIEEYDKFIFIGYPMDKTVKVGKDKRDQYKPVLTILPKKDNLEIIYIAKHKSYANNVGKLIKNCVNLVEKVGYKLKGLDLKFMEVVYETEGYEDLYRIVINLYDLDKVFYLFQYTDKKNRYWENGNIKTFIEIGRKEGINNFNIVYDNHFTVHGYYTKNGEARLEIQITCIDFRIFPNSDNKNSKRNESKNEVLVEREDSLKKIYTKLFQLKYLQFQEICKTNYYKTMRNWIKRLILNYIDKNRHLITRNRCLSTFKMVLIRSLSFMKRYILPNILPILFLIVYRVLIDLFCIFSLVRRMFLKIIKR